MNKKRSLLVGAISMFLVLFGAGLLCGCSESSHNNRNFYALTLCYDEKTNILSGQEEVKYFNNSENAFENLYFHLYPNAFRENAKAKVVSSAKEGEAYYAGDSYGHIEIHSVEIEKQNTAFSISGEDENILDVQLLEMLFPDEWVEITISFTVQLPFVSHRFGVGQNTINFGNFYPIACVYEEGKGFIQSLYHSNGDPFYSDCSDYKVVLDYAKSFSLATSGEVLEQKDCEERTVSTISANNVRDFCFVLSERFDKVCQMVDEVEVQYFGYKGDEDSDKNLSVAVNALQTFNEMFGVYPYKTLSIVKANFLHGGMEYPNLVLISDNLENEDYEYVIVHEIAHQWWYGVVGNDQYNHAWLDEGLAEYSTLLFFKYNSQYGQDFNQMIKNAEKSFKLYADVFMKVNGKVDGQMDKAVCEYATEPEYVQCTYTKGALLMDSIRKSVGEKKFIKALQQFYEKYQFQNVTPEDFIAIFNKTSKTDLEGLIKSWLYDKVVLGK